MWRKESSEPRHGKYLEPLGFGETQSLWRRVIPGPPGPGESQSQPVIWVTGPLARLLAPEGGRAAQRTLRNRRDGVVRLGEAAASHTCSGLVPLCPTRQNCARIDTPPPAAAILPTAGPPGSAVAQLEGSDIAGGAASLRRGPPRGKLPAPPHRLDQRHAGAVRQVHVRGGVEQHQVGPRTGAEAADV